jgi:hypothetical protein
MLVFFTATTGAGIVTADFHGCHLISNNSGNEPPFDRVGKTGGAASRILRPGGVQGMRTSESEPGDIVE